MAEHDHDDAHAHDHAHDDERLNQEITADRERMFDTFIRFTAWNVVGIFAILALLALTQT